MKNDSSSPPHPSPTHLRLSEWKRDPRSPGIRYNTFTGFWYLNQRVGDKVLSEKTPFTENQKTQARDYRVRRMVEEKARQKAVAKVLSLAPVVEVGKKPELLTWGDVANIWLFRLKNNPALSSLTRENREVCYTGLKNIWQKVHKKSFEAELVSEDLTDKLVAWQGEFAHHFSAAYTNKCRTILSALYDVAIERGIDIQNCAKKLPFVPVRPKSVNLPNREIVAKIFENLRQMDKDSADFCEGMVYTGLRRNEAAQLRVEHVVLDNKHPRVELPAEIVKNQRRPRAIPIQGEVLDLFTRLVRESGARDGKIFAVNECRYYLKQACKKAGIRPLSHHKLRHLFATMAYEQTANAALVAKWLGHGDGGILVLRTYNHVRHDHELAAAAKLNFGLRG